MINPRIAVVVTGLIVGFVGVLLAWGASQGCESVRGVGSCGGIGLFALLAVVAHRGGRRSGTAQGVADHRPDQHQLPRRGHGRRMALLFFLGQLESVWMLVVIPVLTAITFLISWWVTETFVEQGADDNIHR